MDNFYIFADTLSALKKYFLVRSWLLFLFIIPCLRLAAQTDSSVRKEPAVQAAPVQVQRAPGDTAARPVKKKAPVVKRDSAGVIIPASALKPAAPAAPAVTPSTTPAVATVPAKAAASTDSVQQQAVVPLKQETAFELFLKELTAKNVFLKANKPSRLDVNKLRVYEDLDWLVYVMAGVVLLLGIIRLSYLKYFSDLFRAFLNPTLSQRQLKDQLSQSPFPNFLLNSYFVISLALYLYLLMYRQQYITSNTAWMAIPGLIVLVAMVYGVKYVMLRFCGWLFGSAELADAYIFILYLINKVLGILLVPFLVILAFCTPQLAKAFMYISIFFIVLLVAYRYIRSYSVVKQYLSFSRLHFFLYLCAFEVAPVLIITKVLLVALTGGL
ncbi:DUF4271 domain-containing protein [Chitinophaga sp. S165]|uniref:DUF4271 domain-containing protein n=1 Tax=Chitinophaga sp. S165 TaxID=2135462 RepID=UPI000D70DCB3|nr:DUF4271 domain-containing protein [Chitinophaga sp. S165]PWV54142.1 uncharacterized protein DUF4271 [Chitinophaga sp. S165]